MTDPMDRITGHMLELAHQIKQTALYLHEGGTLDKGPASESFSGWGENLLRIWRALNAEDNDAKEEWLDQIKW